MEPMPDRDRAARLRRGFRMIRTMVAMHPRVFATAVVGAAIFATCTVLSSVALRWVIDHVFVPRFDDGEVESSSVAAGITFVFVVGVVRSAGVVMRRVFATKTQFRVGASLGRQVVDRLVRQPVSWH